MIPNKKALEIVLSTLKGFDEPVPELEQYITPSDIAADLLWNAFMDGRIKDKTVFDFGCGTGILSIGAALLGAKNVKGFDIDKNALDAAKQNLDAIKKTGAELGEIEFVEKNIQNIREKCDTVVMNPPFGVQKEHADKIFLEKSFETGKCVYTIHKSGSERFLLQLSRQKGFFGIKLGEYGFVIKKTMIFHEKSKYPVKVDVWRFLANNIN